ncbi:lysostaphin resistance A-like protein [Kocuria sp. M1R5S2]|uniref:CPBP family intramembrane glutamic endopeptidase n=1 Tax=Kocuria rhizosphaerae TaxID=3376285 RepID=UPI0037A93455
MTMRTTPWAARPLDGPRPGPGVRVLPYHRLGHADPGHRWWKPIVELVVFGAVYLVLAVVLGVVWALALMGLRGPDALDEAFADVGRVDLLDPAVLVMVLVSVILMIPAVLVGRLVIGARPLGLLLSVTGRLRWRVLGRATAIALAVYVLGHGALLLVEFAALGAYPAPEPVDAFPLVVLMVVLLVPLQSAAEELLFRGVLLQAVGSWVRRPVVAILLPVPLFTFGHFYDVFGLLGVAAMAVVAGWVTWRTGGLEAAIALHVVNNLLAFSFGALGWAEPGATETPWYAPVASTVLQLVFAWLVVRSARKHHVEVTRTVRLPPPGGSGTVWPGPGPRARALGAPALGAPAPGAPAGWVCPGPPACPGHWAGQSPAPLRLP